MGGRGAGGGGGTPPVTLLDKRVAEGVEGRQDARSVGLRAGAGRNQSAGARRWRGGTARRLGVGGVWRADGGAQSGR